MKGKKKSKGSVHVLDFVRVSKGLKIFHKLVSNNNQGLVSVASLICFLY